MKAPVFETSFDLKIDDQSFGKNFRGPSIYAFAHAKVKKLIFYFKIQELTGHIGIRNVEFRKNPGIESINFSMIFEISY